MQLKAPILETSRLLLRELSINDIPILLEQFSQAELQAYLGVETENALNAEIIKLSGAAKTPRFSFKIWYIIEKVSNRVIGDIAYHIWFLKHHRAEIGYGLRQEKDKRKGYMSEAVAAVLEYGFTKMNLNRIEACISPINTASLQLVRKFGFQQEGYFRQHYLNRETGEVDDSLGFSLVAADYKKLKLEPLTLSNLVQLFENRNLPAKYWTHEAHLTVAVWYLSQYPKLEATCWLRSGIIAYNIATGGKNTPTGGYHETITLFWIDIIADFLNNLEEGLTVEEKVKRFLASPMSDKNLPFTFYSRERLMSTEARAVWVAADVMN